MLCGKSIFILVSYKIIWWEGHIHTEYTLGLALFDFIPVVLSAIAVCLLARWMQGGFALSKPAWIGALTVTAGGLSKAMWKLIVVTTKTDIQIMNNALFPLLGAGFVLLAVSFLMGLLKKERWIWPVGLLVIAAFYLWSYTKLGAENPKSWSFVLLGMTAGFSTLLSLGLSGLGLARKIILSALLIFGSIGGSFYLAKLARLPDQTLALQWKEELLNTATQGAFLIGVLLLTKAMFRKANQT